MTPTPNNASSPLQQRILEALKDGDKTCSEVTRALNRDDQYKALTVFQVRSWLLTLCDLGEVVEKANHRYGLGYSPTPTGGEAA